MLLNQVGDDLSIGFGAELMPLGYQLPLELKIVFDNAIVHHCYPTSTMGVSIGL